MTSKARKLSKRSARHLRAARKPRGQGHERIDEILAAAQGLFLTEGYEAVTTRRLAQHAGLSQTGLYLYFQSKEDIHEALCRRTFEKLSKRLRRVAKASSRPEDMLRQAARAYISFGLEHPDEYRIVFMQKRPTKVEAESDPTRALPSPSGLQAFITWRDFVSATLENGALTSSEATSVAFLIWLAIHGFVSSWITLPNLPWPPRNRMVEDLIETVLTGLRKRLS
jgi:AcrR family transcriptional regulator